MYKKDNKTKETFGDLKENIGHDRLYRRGHDNVQMEMYLVAMGHNIRDYRKQIRRVTYNYNNKNWDGCPYYKLHFMHF